MPAFGLRFLVLLCLQLTLGEGLHIRAAPVSADFEKPSQDLLSQRHFAGFTDLFWIHEPFELVSGCPLDFARLYMLSAAHQSPRWDCNFGSGPWCLADRTSPSAWVWQGDFDFGDSANVCSYGALRFPYRVDQFWEVKQFPLGEASNPGPPLHITFGNPSGLRGKEAILYGLPRGIQNLGERHLANCGQQAACGLLRNWARTEQRRLHLLPGADVPLRSRSNTTGVWSGVFQSADVPGVRFNLPWPQNEFRLGRTQAATFRVGPVNVLGVVVYAWPTSPTWPKAKDANRTLLRFLTEEVIYGSSGCRYICGDFNGTDDDYPDLAIWRAHGWCEIQELHLAKTGSILPTCKGATRPDRMYASPELARRYLDCKILDLLPDHSVIQGSFDLNFEDVHYDRWPRVSKIPWQAMDCTSWEAAQHAVPPFDASRHNSTEYFEAFGRQYEDSMGPYFEPDPARGLPAPCRGRAQVFAPRPQQLQAPRLAASRQGEETMASDMLCRAMQRWFTQLRRLQSLLHNVRRDSDHAAAVSYRLLTWQSIKLAKGFPGGLAWWPLRPVQVQGSPAFIPEQLPAVALLEQIFMDFRSNFRALESWNLRHRSQILKVTAGEQAKKAFQEILLLPMFLFSTKSRLLWSLESMPTTPRFRWTLTCPIPKVDSGFWMTLLQRSPRLSLVSTKCRVTCCFVLAKTFGGCTRLMILLKWQHCFMIFGSSDGIGMSPPQSKIGLASWVLRGHIFQDCRLTWRRSPLLCGMQPIEGIDPTQPLGLMDFTTWTCFGCLRHSRWHSFLFLGQLNKELHGHNNCLRDLEFVSQSMLKLRRWRSIAPLSF